MPGGGAPGWCGCARPTSSNGCGRGSSWPTPQPRRRTETRRWNTAPTRHRPLSSVTSTWLRHLPSDPAEDRPMSDGLRKVEIERLGLGPHPPPNVGGGTFTMGADPPEFPAVELSLPALGGWGAPD